MPPPGPAPPPLLTAPELADMAQPRLANCVGGISLARARPAQRATAQTAEKRRIYGMLLNWNRTNGVRFVDSLNVRPDTSVGQVRAAVAPYVTGKVTPSPV